MALRLVSGDRVELFKWKRSADGIPSGEGKKSSQSAQRLQKLVRELKQPRAVAQTARPIKCQTTIRDVGSSGVITYAAERAVTHNSVWKFTAPACRKSA